jgi:DNA primase large subunit
MEKTKNQLIERVSDLTRPSKYVKDYKAPKEVMPDLILVSPRHLFRMPYSLHEKTALASVVLDPDEISKFDLKHADALKIKIKNFIPDSKEGEASELLMQALDWYKESNIDKKEKTFKDFKPIKLSNFSEDFFPPCVKNILNGLRDGRKRAVFVLINLFRSIGMDKEEVEKRIYAWNEKNKPPIKTGYIKSQLISSYRSRPLMPPNCKEYYKGIAVCTPDNTCKLIKNPVNYVVRRNIISQQNNKKSNKFKKKD